MAKARISRRLFLHLSALSDVEYGVYTEALHDLFDDQNRQVPDDELETRRVGAREVRAWMKGRFRDLTVADIDHVLGLFTSQISDTDEFTGGQLLAALRLFMHARHGGQISEAGVFIQAEPSSPTGSYQSPFFTWLSKSDATAEGEQSFRTRSKAYVDREMVSERSPVIQKGLSTKSTPESPPISKRASLPSSAPPVPPSFSKPGSDASEMMVVPAGSTNPFLQRAKTHTGSVHSGSSETKIPPLPPRKPSYISVQGSSTSQLLLGKPSPSLSQSASLQNRSSSNSSATANSLPFPTPPLPPPLSRAPFLERQSKECLKKGTMVLKTPADRDRIVQSTRTSLDSSRDRVQNLSQSPEKSHRRLPPRPPSPKSERSVSRRQSQDRCHTTSALSVSEDEGTKEQGESRALSAPEQYAAPPLHPARRSSIHVSSMRTSPRHTQRHSRSPSFHVSSTSSSQDVKETRSPVHTRTASSSSSPSSSPPPPISPSVTNASIQRSARPHTVLHTSITDSVPGRHSPPLPPPRPKRPESMQLAPRASRTHNTDPKGNTGSSSNTITNSFERPPSATGVEFASSPLQSGSGVKQRQERDRSPSTSSAGVSTSSFSFAQLQKKFSAFQQRAQPALDRVRYKAEAGLAPRRGYVVPSSRVDLPAHLQRLAGETAGNRLVPIPRKSMSSRAGDVVDLDSGNESGDARAGVYGMSLDSDEEDNASFDEWGGGSGSMAVDTTDGETTVRGRKGRPQDMQERDNLKLPEGEGWAPLR